MPIGAAQCQTPEFTVAQMRLGSRSLRERIRILFEFSLDFAFICMFRKCINELRTLHLQVPRYLGTYSRLCLEA